MSSLLFGVGFGSIVGAGDGVRAGDSVGVGEGEGLGVCDVLGKVPVVAVWVTEGLRVGLIAGDGVGALTFTHIPGGRLMKSPCAPAESQTFTSTK